MTPISKQTLEFIVKFEKENGFYPLGIEIKEEFQISSAGASARIANLEQDGYISRKKLSRRKLEITQKGIDYMARFNIN